MQRLKIIALEPAETPVVAAHLQDALCGISELDYSAASKRFVALLNRYAWEQATPSGGSPEKGERRRCALRVDRVLRARSTGIDRKARGGILSVLTIEFEPDEAAPPSGTLTIVFAGNASIKLDVECVEMVLEDLGQVWKAGRRPSHPEDDGNKR